MSEPTQPGDDAIVEDPTAETTPQEDAAPPEEDAPAVDESPADESTDPSEAETSETETTDLADQPEPDAVDESGEAAPVEAPDEPGEPAADTEESEPDVSAESEPEAVAAPVADEPTVSDEPGSAEESVSGTADAAAVPEGAQSSSRRRWAAVVVIAVVVALIASGAIWAAVYYGERAKPGVQIADVDVSGQTATELSATVSGILDAMTVTFRHDGETHEVNVSDLGIGIDTARIAQAALAAGDGVPFYEAYNPFHAKEVALVLDSDDERLQREVDSYFLGAEGDSADAGVSYDEAAGKFVVTPGEIGSTIDIAPIKEALAHPKAFADGVTLTERPVAPVVSDQAAEAAATTANERLGLDVVLDSAAGDYTVTAADIAAWTTFTTRAATSGDDQGSVAVGYDQAAIKRSLEAEAVGDLEDEVQHETILVSPEGNDIVTSEQGSDGVVISDLGAVASDVAGALDRGQNAVIDVATTVTEAGVERVTVPSNFNDPNGAKWIDINLSTYTLNAYEGTTHVYGPISVVTGASGTPTDPGTFYVWYKLPIQTMRGEGYVTENVRWVSYYNGDEAVHGAWWRSSFGYAASHGCVNLPESYAKWIYDWAPLGTKVEVHY
ncbi:MAG: L,D-transpeptidase family protein [Propionibacteriaceae bacterium]|nr:L,D-transpeptidase family protein [Propionibacteriaceae bacterium]